MTLAQRQLLRDSLFFTAAYAVIVAAVIFG